MTKVLFIAPYLPNESGSGGAIRTRHIWEDLKCFYDADFVLADSGSRDLACMVAFRKNDNLVGRVPINVWVKPESFRRQAFNEQIRDIIESGQYQYIVVRYYFTAYWLGITGLSNLVIDCDDCLVEANRGIRTLFRNNFIARANYYFSYFWVEARYKRDIAKCPVVMFSKNEGDVKWRSNFHVLENRIDEQEGEKSAPTKDDTLTILFIGLLGYYPNYIGLDQFIDRSWPAIYKNLHGKVCLRIVGIGLPDAFRLKWACIPGISYLGYLESLEEAYRDVDVSIVPTHQGSGTHLKVLESMARRVPVVVSPKAHRGFENDLIDNKSLMVAIDDEDFSNKIVYLSNHANFRRELSENARAAVEMKYIYKKGDMRLKNILMNIDNAGEPNA